MMINKILEAICAVILAMAVLIGFISVIFRYVFNSALSWSFEASLALLTYITFVGCYLALRKNSHLKVDVLVRMLPPFGQAVMFTVNQLLITAISGVMLYHGGRQTLLFLDQKTLVMEIPSGFLYVAIPVSGVLMGIDAVVTLICGWRRYANGQPLVDDDGTPSHSDI